MEHTSFLFRVPPRHPLQDKRRPPWSAYRSALSGPSCLLQCHLPCSCCVGFQNCCHSPRSLLWQAPGSLTSFWVHVLEANTRASPPSHTPLSCTSSGCIFQNPHGHPRQGGESPCAPGLAFSLLHICSISGFGQSAQASICTLGCEFLESRGIP